MSAALVLLPIGRDGTIPHAPVALDEPTKQVCSETAALYERVGHEPPFVGYVAFDGARYVGACGFTRPPRGGQVEIAYITFPGFEGRGLATKMARALLDIADGHDIIAHTRPESSASTAVLQKLGFQLAGRVSDPEHGIVWQWQLDSVV
jgi:RimJ/RimL family protein N-acetyltransferase